MFVYGLTINQAADVVNQSSSTVFRTKDRALAYLCWVLKVRFGEKIADDLPMRPFKVEPSDEQPTGLDAEDDGWLGVDDGDDMPDEPD